MKEHEQKDDNLEDEYYIETVDEAAAEEVYDLKAEKESMNEKFSWGWFRLEESLITKTERC